MNSISKFGMRSALVVAAATLIAAFAAADKVAIVNARIEIGNGSIIERGSILLDGSRIEAVGADLSFDEAEYRVVDGAGMTVYPGFIDAYTRAFLDLPKSPESDDPPDSVTTAPATFWHENRKGVFPELVAAEHVDAEGFDDEFWGQGITTVQVSSGRAAFGGYSAIINLTTDESTRTLRAKSGQYFSLSSSSGSGYPGSLMARTALMRQLLLDANAYRPSGDENQVLAALADATSRFVPTLFAGRSARDIHRVLAVTDDFGLKTIIVGGDEAWMKADELLARRIAVIVDVEPNREPSTELNEDPVRRLNDPPIEVLQARHAEWEEESQYVVKLYEAGVPFAFTGDSDRDALLENVRWHIGRGLPRDAALRALTIGAAEILGISDEVGTIEAGKLANLAIFTGDFALDASEVRTVFVAGEQHDIEQEEQQ